MWLGAVRRGGVRKAARWDGWIAVAMSDDGGSMVMPPDAFADLVTMVRSEREVLGLAGRSFDIAVLGVAGMDGFDPADYADAGATWWLESLSPMRGSIVELEAVIRRGPRS